MLRSIALVSLLAAMPAWAELGDIYCFEDEALWNALAANVESLTTDADGVALANEVPAPPGSNSQLGKILTFDAAVTGLSRGFLLETLDPSTDILAGFTFSDGEPNPSADFIDALSVGDINNFQNDDWRFSVVSGETVASFAFILRQNGDTDAEEAMIALDAADQVLDQCQPVPVSDGADFFGLIASVPVTKVIFNEGDGDGGSGSSDDDIALADPRFGDAVLDSDGDGIPFYDDNCMLRPNADQRDSNGDGFGNACDADLNGDCIVNALDLGIFKAVFFSSDADADLNGDGVVNAQDLGIFKLLFFSVPGPSGLQHPCG